MERPSFVDKGQNHALPLHNFPYLAILIELHTFLLQQCPLALNVSTAVALEHQHNRSTKTIRNMHVCCGRVAASKTAMCNSLLCTEDWILGTPSRLYMISSLLPLFMEVAVAIETRHRNARTTKYDCSMQHPSVREDQLLGTLHDATGASIAHELARAMHRCCHCSGGALAIHRWTGKHNTWRALTIVEAVSSSEGLPGCSFVLEMASAACVQRQNDI